MALNAPPLLDGFAWPRLTRWWRAPLIGEGLMGSTTRGMLARSLRHGSVREDAWPDARVATVWDQFDQGTQRAILRLVRSAPENSGGADPQGSAGTVDAGDPQARSAGTVDAGDPQARSAGTVDAGDPHEPSGDPEHRARRGRVPANRGRTPCRR